MLVELLSIKCFAYTAIYEKNLADHNNKLKDMFLAFKNANLKLKTDK